MTAPDARDELRVLMSDALDRVVTPVYAADEILDALIPVVAAWAEKQARARVEAVAEEIAGLHERAKVDARAERDGVVRNQYIGLAWGLGDALTRLRPDTAGNPA